MLPGSHSERSGRHRRDAKPCAGRKCRLAGRERKEVEAIHIQIDACKKVWQIRCVDALRKDFDFDFRVDVSCHRRKDFNLLEIDGRNGRTDLAIEVFDRERIEVGNVKGAYPQARERQKVNAADATHAGNRHPLVLQSNLFRGGDPPDVAGKGVPVRESIVHWGWGSAWRIRSI